MILCNKSSGNCYARFGATAPSIGRPVDSGAQKVLAKGRAAPLYYLQHLEVNMISFLISSSVAIP